jgi:hypothetical protein
MFPLRRDGGRVQLILKDHKLSGNVEIKDTKGAAIKDAVVINALTDATIKYPPFGSDCKMANLKWFELRSFHPQSSAFLQQNLGMSLCDVQ